MQTPTTVTRTIFITISGIAILCAVFSISILAPSVLAICSFMSSDCSSTNKTGIAANVTSISIAPGSLCNHSHPAPQTNATTFPNPGAQQNGQEYVARTHFEPRSVNTKIGTNITWTNNDTVSLHTVTSGNSTTGPSGEFDSGILKGCTTFKHTFHKSGAFNYFDTVHPSITGWIVVK
jgi:plastocyanin